MVESADSTWPISKKAVAKVQRSTLHLECSNISPSDLESSGALDAGNEMQSRLVDHKNSNRNHRHRHRTSSLCILIQRGNWTSSKFFYPPKKDETKIRGNSKEFITVYLTFRWSPKSCKGPSSSCRRRDQSWMARQGILQRYQESGQGNGRHIRSQDHFSSVWRLPITFQQQQSS